MKIEWKGGECPVHPGTNVCAWIRAAGCPPLIQRAGLLRWAHENLPGDIVAYEVLDEDDVAVWPWPTREGVLIEHRPDANVDPSTETFGPLPEGNGDANGEGKQTNPKDLIGSRKAKFSVIPAGVLFDLGNAMTEGMCKYGRHNYRHVGIRASVYYDAACGHLADWWEGQDIDAESGLSHVTKALASLVVLRDAMLQDMMTDDRPPRSKVFKSDFSPLTAEIIDRHKDKNPRHFTIADTREGA